MAKFLLQDMIQKDKKSDVEVLSAGLGVYAPMPISHHAYTLLSEKSIDPSSHYSMAFTPDLVEEDSLILTMSLSHKEAILARYPFLSKQTYALFEYVNAGRNISDPFGGSLETYRQTLSEIELLISKLYLQI
jgi:protein-tyrosine phosphatase